MPRFLIPVITIVGILAIAAVFVFSAATPAVVIPNPTVDAPLASAKGEQTVVVAGGCFWGVQAVFEHVKGVTVATAGYSGGQAGTAHYEMVSDGNTGHAESVQVKYDPSKISFGRLLKVFFSVAHNPTELNRQGPDYGTQYRSVIFYTSDDQQRIATAYIDQLNKANIFESKIVTQVVPLKAFYNAEDYHQDYAVHHPYDPYIMSNDLPKVSALRKLLPDLYVTK